MAAVKQHKNEANSSEPPLSPRPRLIVHGLTLATAGGLLLGLAWVTCGQIMVEKLLSSLAMPLGLCWLILIGLVYYAVLKRQICLAGIGFFSWLILTAGGNFFVSNWLIAQLEQPFQQTNLDQLEPLDVIVILGGGTESRLSGDSQLVSSGDRIATAARLYHSGQVTTLICTGSESFNKPDYDLHPREEAFEILQDLGIPADNIVQLPGRNTSEEMQSLKTWLAEHPNQKRVGLLTSAWHLSRALRLSKSHGLELTPVPSNFLTQAIKLRSDMIIPKASSLETTSNAIKEYLAGLIGR